MSDACALSELHEPPFALLDDSSASEHRRSSRLYECFVREHRCTDPDSLDAVVAAAQADMAAGLHALVLIDYEWGAKLQRAGTGRLHRNDGSALRLLMFSELRHLSREEVDRWLATREGSAQPAPGGVLEWRKSLDDVCFEQAVDRIQQAIRDGEAYQVNFTYRLHGQVFCSPVSLYRRLRLAQPVSYGAFMALPVDHGAPSYVLSCSPELFLRHEAGVLTARPMKGTAPRTGDRAQDQAAACWLASDPKNRAENVMIVDLLRNDLSRVAQLGSIRVPSLFAVESHASLYQMTSTVQARLRVQASLADVLRATFPCGSITGAPKLRAMDMIAALETQPRGLYTGSIGWLDAARGGARCGDFVLSVAIRTLILGPADARNSRTAQLGVGAGIVIDSVAGEELAECGVKARFAQVPVPLPD